MQDFNFTDEQKVSILSDALKERYVALHTIRERVQNISLWTLGLFITAAGWLMQRTEVLTCEERVFASFMILVSVFVLRFVYLQNLEIGFKGQQKIQAKLEEALGFYSPGVLGPDSVYPEKWLRAGTPKGKGGFFWSNYLIIYLGTFFLLLSIWLS